MSPSLKDRVFKISLVVQDGFEFFGGACMKATIGTNTIFSHLFGYVFSTTLVV